MVEVCTRSIDTGFVALGYAKVAVLGVVQGITELLPISSTAHMRLVPAVLGWQDPGSAFSAAMQLAALAAVVSYFWSDVRDLVANSLQAIARGQFYNRDFRFSLWIVLATIPIGIAGLFLAKLLNTCNSPLRAVSVIGFAYYNDPANKPLLNGLQLDGVDATVANMAGGTYKLAADGHMYTNGTPSGLTAAFLAYMLGPDIQGTLIPSLSYAPVVK